MRRGGTEVVVTTLPECDVCAGEGVARPAAFDGKTIYGPWANLCPEHHEAIGLGLGLGVGQRLILREEVTS